MIVCFGIIAEAARNRDARDDEDDSRRTRCDFPLDGTAEAARCECDRCR